MAGYDEGYDWFYQERPQAIDLATAVLKIAPQPLRVIAQNQPLIPLSDRYVIIGQRYDLDRRRFVQIAEQIIYSPSIVGALVWEEPLHATAALGGAMVLGAGIHVARQAR